MWWWWRTAFKHCEIFNLVLNILLHFQFFRRELFPLFRCKSQANKYTLLFTFISSRQLTENKWKFMFPRLSRNINRKNVWIFTFFSTLRKSQAPLLWHMNTRVSAGFKWLNKCWHFVECKKSPQHRSSSYPPSSPFPALLNYLVLRI